MIRSWTPPVAVLGVILAAVAGAASLPARMEIFHPAAYQAEAEFQVRAEEHNPRCEPASWRFESPDCTVRMVKSDTAGITCPKETAGLDVEILATPVGPACRRLGTAKAGVAISGRPRLPPCEPVDCAPGVSRDVCPGRVQVPPGTRYSSYYRPGRASTGKLGIRVLVESYPCVLPD